MGAPLISRDTLARTCPGPTQRVINNLPFRTRSGTKSTKMSLPRKKGGYLAKLDNAQFTFGRSETFHRRVEPSPEYKLCERLVPTFGPPPRNRHQPGLGRFGFVLNGFELCPGLHSWGIYGRRLGLSSGLVPFEVEGVGLSCHLFLRRVGWRWLSVLYLQGSRNRFGWHLLCSPKCGSR